APLLQRLLDSRRALQAPQRRGSRHRAGADAAAARAGRHGEPARQHPGHPRLAPVLPRRRHEPALPDTLRRHSGAVSLRVLTYNILKSALGREAAIAAVIAAARPDIVILQEAYRPEAVRTIARAGGFAHWGSSAGHSVAFLSHLEVAQHAWRRVWLAK